MRFRFLNLVATFAVWAALTGSALTITTGPARAEWITYISHPLGFSFKAPKGMTVEKKTYRGELAGTHNAIVYRAVENNIVYSATVVDLDARKDNSANMIGEAEYEFQQGNKVLMDTFASVDMQFGRKLTVDHADKRDRSTALFYFVNGRLYYLEATVLPDGDLDTPKMGLFVDSITFASQRVPPDSTELPLPK